MQKLKHIFALCAMCLVVAGCAYDRRAAPAAPEVPVEPAETWRDCPGVMEGGEPVAILARLDARVCSEWDNELRRLLLGANIVFAEGMGGLERWTSSALNLLDHTEDDNGMSLEGLRERIERERAVKVLLRAHPNVPFRVMQPVPFRVMQPALKMLAETGVAISLEGL